MKQFGLLLILLISLSSTGAAQKYAYINSEEILNQIPDYKNAQKELDDLSAKWQKEIEEKYKEIEEKDKAYQEEKIVLPDEMKTKRETEIAKLLEDVRAFQKEKFGVGGALFKKRQELIQPIQEKLYKAIKDISNNRYDMVFDIAKQSNLLYANPRLNIGDKVLDKMGY